MSSLTLAMVGVQLAAQLALRAVERRDVERGAGPPLTCSWTMRHRRFMKRCAPSTPESDHSRLCSGGAANMVNSRTVSAP
jgi:hypothetical protein